ncbi:LuxR C-terminal-related transcriptional regulator [Micromonosporaceae bacterium DT194]|uniref:LuxR C-terminal-related transcriptional regulator n=1 Tax=Melissospora conviva TaxID=3388432 RepID=UPI003C285389
MSRARTRPAGGPTAPPVRILLVDEQPMLRAGFRTVLGAETGLDVVAEAGDGRTALELARRLLPDIVMMDARTPRLDAAGLLGALTAARLPVRVLVLATDGLDSATLAALRAGAQGVLSKDVPAADLVAAVHALATGAGVLAPGLLAELLKGVDVDRPEVPPAAPHVLTVLTDREQEVLGQVARGLSNAEIAQALSVSEATVKSHVGNVLTKLALRDRAQAVVLAYETGLIRPGSR